MIGTDRPFVPTPMQADPTSKRDSIVDPVNYLESRTLQLDCSVPIPGTVVYTSSSVGAQSTSKRELNWPSLIVHVWPISRPHRSYLPSIDQRRSNDLANAIENIFFVALGLLVWSTGRSRNPCHPVPIPKSGRPFASPVPGLRDAP